MRQAPVTVSADIAATQESDLGAQLQQVRRLTRADLTVTAAPRLTGAGWAAMIADPVRDHGYQLTGLGPSAADYLARRAVAGLADRTLDQYERDLARLCLIYPDKAPAEIATRDLEHAIATFPPGSRPRARAAYRAYFDSLYADGVIPADPSRRLPTYTVARQRIVDVFTPAEQDALKHLPGELRDRALTTLLLESGLRKTEASSLTMRDIDLATGRVSVRKGKGRKGRVVPVPPTATAIIAELAVLEGLDRPDHLWYTRYRNQTGETIRRSRQLGPGGFHRWWGRVCDETGVRYRNVHTCRHTYATVLLARGVPMAAVSRLLGHATIRTTVDIYAHLAVDDLALEVDRAFQTERVAE